MDDKKKSDLWLESLFGGLFGANGCSKEYIEALKRAQEYLAFEAEPINYLVN